MIYLPELVELQLKELIKSQEFLASYDNPMYYVFKDIPKEGEVRGDWLESEWKTKK